MRRSAVWALVVSFVASASAFAEEPLRTTLPEEHEHQRVLRRHLASLAEKDFDLGVTEKFTQPADVDDSEVRYRHWLLGLLNQPMIGSKRGAPAVNAPSRLFTLAAIETPEGVMQPPLWPDPTAWAINWDYAGNPYRGSRGLKQRTFVSLCVLLTMVEDHVDHPPEGIGPRLETLAPSVLTLAWSYLGVRDVAPAEVRQAYESGLRRLGRRLLDEDPAGMQPNLVCVAPIALWHVAQVLQDDAFSKEVESLGRRIWADPAFFRPAGYYVDRGGVDIGYAGSANVFTTWAALAAGWPFAKDALDRAYRLRGYLSLVDPDGQSFGPTHFNSRLGSDPVRDQWEWGVYRDTAASLVTDEAIHLTRLPTPTELADGAPARSRAFQGQLNENAVNAARNGFIRNDEITSHPWKFRQWTSWSFPLAVNYASDHCPPGAFAKRAKLEEEKSPLLVSPWEREPTFLRSLENEFTFAKRAGYRAIVHSGTVGGDDGHKPQQSFLDFSGFSGGELSAFWTPATGSVILGRRGGASRMKNFDTVETWRTWPIHAVTGTTPEGKVFTSARIRRPDVTIDAETVRVGGSIPSTSLGQEKAFEGEIAYERRFALGSDRVRIETSVEGDGKQACAELYETIPVFLRETARQPNAAPTSIQFQAGGKWLPAGTEWTEGVTAIRLTRFEGSVDIAFDAPRRVKLSAEDWVDAYMSRASCRNILVDLLEGKVRSQPFGKAKVGYTIAQAK